MRFSKYHGLGNDFIIVDRRDGGEPLLPASVIAACDRHRGIGADGVLSIWPLAGAHGRMQVQNADGSESAMCGNGLRCVARYLHDNGETASTLMLGAGERHYDVLRTKANHYRVSMGQAALAHTELPSAIEGKATVAALGRSFDATVVHMGNPHMVIFCTGEEDPLALAQQYGAALEHTPGFVARANVSFAVRTEYGFDAVVFERGVGITQACGSGACAVAVSGAVRGLVPFDQTCEVRLLGGPLSIVVSRALDVTMEGEAVRVFSGYMEIV